MMEIPKLFKINLLVPTICIPVEVYSRVCEKNEDICIKYINVNTSIQNKKIIIEDLYSVNQDFVDKYVKSCEPKDYSFVIQELINFSSNNLLKLQEKTNKETVNHETLYDLVEQILNAEENEDENEEDKKDLELTDAQISMIRNINKNVESSQEFLKDVAKNLKDSIKEVYKQFEINNIEEDFTGENKNVINKIREDLEKRIIKNMPDDMFYKLEELPDEFIALAINNFNKEGLI